MGKKSPYAGHKSFKGFKGLGLSKDVIGVKFEGRDLNLALPVYYEVNRYYLPLSEIIDKLGGQVVLEQNQARVMLNGQTVTIDCEKNTYSNNNGSGKLRKKAIVSDEVVYLSLFDLHKIFDLRVDWGVTDKTLALFYNRQKVTPKTTAQSDKQAMLRLEDVSVREYFINQPEEIQKLTIVADYLYSENIPFHIAWVPRYIDPGKNIDIDPSRQYSFVNADFIYALDYMLDRNGIMGLHGYTHQYGQRVSIAGVEFMGKGIPGDQRYTQERIDSAIAAAKALDIPYGFFEAPHYAISVKQLAVAEQNFDIIFEPYPGVKDKIVYRQQGNRKIKYVPTPLDYLNGKSDLHVMIGRIMNLQPGIIGSFFYNPIMEFQDINLSRDAGGYPAYTYSGSSVLHQLVGVFHDRGYKFVTVDQVK